MLPTHDDELNLMMYPNYALLIYQMDLARAGLNYEPD